MIKLRIMNLPTAYNRFMTRFSHLVTLGLALLGLAACGAAPKPAPPQSANSAVPRERLSRMVDRYWDEHESLGAAISPQVMADSLAVERRYLAEILAVPRATLDTNSRLTYDIFRRQRELAVEGFTYPTELLAVDPFGGMPQQLAHMAADTGQAPLTTARDYENWLRRIDDYGLWTQQAISNMREGIRRGYTSPRAVIERTLPVLERLGEDTSANVFYVPLRSMPETIKDPERTRLGANFSTAVKDKLLPAYRALHDFLQREYLPRARVSVALSALPLGSSWYAYRVRVNTSTLLTPNEIHSIGLTEVERIRARMQSLSAGTAPVVGAVLSAYTDLKAQTLAAMPTLFSAVPPSDFEIRAVDPFSQVATRLSYQPAGPGGTSAVLYVDISSTSAGPATVLTGSFLREAIPGRHYQSALQQARTDLPRFRRFGTEPAFVEGWGLYAASLGEELGLYPVDEAKTGALLDQLRCAAALVVDTGLHAKGWTRTQALDYFRTQLGVDAASADLLVDRFVALPGDALACKMGELKIQALRSRAQQALGTRFDIREFHSEILNDGAMPLDILEAKTTLWIESRR